MQVKKESYGVIIGRFQTPYLTKGHRYLIDTVYNNHHNVIIFIGVSVGQPTKRNPMDYTTRKLMLDDCYPNAIILPIKDNVSDSVWSENIDNSIISATHKDAILYGCRDSFINYYSGKFKTVEIETPHDDNATDIRKKVAENCNCSEQFRAGIIYAISNRFPSPYTTVDVAMIKDDKILFGKKKGEPFYRFIGGFLDSPDESIAFAAKRELSEETGGVEADNFELIGESKINDWRYRNDEENIFTALFKCKYIFGNPTPTDDITHLTWIPIDKLSETEFMPEHKQLVKILINNLKQK